MSKPPNVWLYPEWKPPKLALLQCSSKNIKECSSEEGVYFLSKLRSDKLASLSKHMNKNSHVWKKVTIYLHYLALRFLQNSFSHSFYKTLINLKGCVCCSLFFTKNVFKKIWLILFISSIVIFWMSQKHLWIKASELAMWLTIKERKLLDIFGNLKTD